MEWNITIEKSKGGTINTKYELERNYNVLKYEISAIQYELLQLDEELSPQIIAKYGGIGGQTNIASDKVFNAVSDKEENQVG